MKRIIDYSLIVTTVGVLGMGCKNGGNNSGKSEQDSLVENPIIVTMKNQVRKYPDSTRLYDKLIDQYTTNGDYKSALAWCDSLMARGDSNFSYLLVKGKIFRMAQQHDSAINAYQAYLERFPDDEETLLNLANTAAETGNDISLKMTDDIVKKFPSREVKSEAFFIKGVYESRVKNFDRAIAFFDQAILFRYTFYEVYVEKAIAQYDQKKYDASLATLDELLALKSDYPDAFYWKGKVYEALNNKPEAINNYEAAYTLDRSDVDSKKKLDSLQK